MDSMHGVILTSGALKLFWAVIGMTVLLGLLRWFDRAGGFCFREWLASMQQTKCRTIGDSIGSGIYLGLRFLGVAVLVAWLFGCGTAQAFPTQYDRQIKTSTERWMPGVDWRLWKAQLYQESLLDPAAVSPAGAMGVAQFMPGTWADVSRKLGLVGISPHAAGPAIDAGAYYMGSLRAQWSAPRPEMDRHSLAMASYNAGLGHLLRAQRLAGGAPDYASIIARLPEVTGRHSRETITYVQRIWGYWRQMVLGA